MIGKQTNIQYVYYEGCGQKNMNDMTMTHLFKTATYQMVIELEVADTDLIGKELKMKCSMRTDGFYFLLANKYSDVTSVSDHRVQKFYKQIFSSIALQEENKIYIDRHGEMKKKKRQVESIESKLY